MAGKSNVNRSAAIRLYLEQNPSASTREIIDALSDLKISGSLVGVVRARWEKELGIVSPRSRVSRRELLPGSGDDDITLMAAANLILRCGSRQAAHTAISVAAQIGELLNH